MPAKKEVMVGIDMGGTRLRALVVNAENKILGMQRAPTNPKQKPDRSDRGPCCSGGGRCAVGGSETI